MPASISPAVNGGIPAVLYCLLCLFLMVAGAGAGSVDGWIARRQGEVASA